MDEIIKDLETMETTEIKLTRAINAEYDRMKKQRYGENRPSVEVQSDQILAVIKVFSGQIDTLLDLNAELEMRMEGLLSRQHDLQDTVAGLEATLTDWNEGR